MINRVVPVVVFLGLVAGCKAKLSGEITLDGQKFAISECRNGAALGFAGVQLANSEGVRLRLATSADGTTTAAYFPPNAAQGDVLGTCGTLVTHLQNSKINDISNLAGTATLKCSGSHTLEGTLSFENCH